MPITRQFECLPFPTYADPNYYFYLIPDCERKEKVPFKDDTTGEINVLFNGEIISTKNKKWQNYLRQQNLKKLSKKRF